jgi:outer membrane biogenesis lipoprotein LolB
MLFRLSLLALLLLSGCSASSYSREEVEAAFAERDSALQVLAEAVQQCQSICRERFPEPD